MIRNILDYLEHSAECYPDKVAFADDKDKCTYRELLERARVTGTYLAQRTKRRSPIPVFMEKGVAADSVYGSGACGLLLCSAGSEASGREA